MDPNTDRFSEQYMYELSCLELYVKPHASSIYAPQKTAGACVATLACFPTSIRRVHGGGGLSRPVPDPHLTSRRTDRSTAWSRLPT